MAKILWTNEEIKILKDMVGKCIGYNDISKVINRSPTAISSKVNDLKLETLYTNNSNFKAIYQDYDWCYEMFMNRGMNHNEMAEEANSSKRVIEKWCCEKNGLTQKFRQRNKQLNQKQRDLIIGSLLGDGHIDKRKTQPMFIVSHAENQKDYLYWKYEILKDLCNIPPTYKEEGIRIFNNKPYVCQPQFRVCTRIHDCLIPLRNMSKLEIIDSLNEFSLSILFLDDGSRDRSNWSVCVAGFNDDEKKFFVNKLNNFFKLDAYISPSDNRYIKLRAESSRILDNIILTQVPNNLDIIKYKITENDNIATAQKHRYINNNGNLILLTEYCKMNNVDYKQTWGKFKDELVVM